MRVVENYRAQADIEDAVIAAQMANYCFSDFIRQARELWAARLEEEAKRIREAPHDTD